MPDIFIEPPAQNDQPEQTPSVQPNQPIQPQPGQQGIGPFTTFCLRPKNISFEGQDDDEQILLFLRKDFATNIPWIITAFILLFVPPLVIFIFREFQFVLFSLPHNFVLLFIIFYYILVIGFIFANFVSWFYNIGLVTTKRAVDIDFFDLATINVATALFGDIKDAEYTQAGFFQSFFDFGDVRMRIEAATETLVFESVPQPAKVVNILSDLVGRGGDHA